MGSEARLFFFLTTNALMLAAGWRLTRRWAGPDIGQRILDTLLWWFVAQYLAVVITGLLGILFAKPLILTAVILSVGAWAAGNGKSAEIRPVPESGAKRGEIYVLVAATTFVLTFLATVIYSLALAPVLSTDGLGYHLPMAVRWMQTGHLEQLMVWYQNPGVTYSPAAAETFIAWSLIPLHSDALARFVQIVPLLMIFVAVIQLAHAAGVAPALAAIVAAGAVLARPLVGQSVIVKDDLFVVAFFLTAAVACVGPAVKDRLGPVRFGIALGLIFASKYTALLTIPVLLLTLDQPKRAGWRARQWIFVILIPSALAGPWYLRNLIHTGNPIYPLDVRIGGLRMFSGLFTVARDARLRSARGIFDMLIEGYYGLPIAVGMLMAIGWLISAWIARKKIWREPVIRFAILATPFGLVAFLAGSPHPEVRYFFPFYPPMFLCCGICLTAIRQIWIQRTTALIVLAIPAVTAFMIFRWETVLVFLIIAVVIAAGEIGVMIVWQTHRLPLLFWRWTMAVGITAIAMFAYVHWNAYLSDCDDSAGPFWHDQYGPLAGAWEFVRDPTKIAAHATIAYANTYLLYPLYGPRYDRKVIYAPLREGLTTFKDLPNLGEDLDGYQLGTIITRAMNAGATADAWRKNLARARADYLLVAKESGDSPELRFARQDASEFHPVMENSAAAVYRLAIRDSFAPITAPG